MRSRLARHDSSIPIGCMTKSGSSADVVEQVIGSILGQVRSSMRFLLESLVTEFVNVICGELNLDNLVCSLP